MRQRCLNPNHTAYHNYGGRGIRVCDRWGVFQNFLDDMGKRPSRFHTLDRIDNDGHYEPSNCRWATRDEQAANRRTNVLLDYMGERTTLSEAARRSGIPLDTLWRRINVHRWPADHWFIPNGAKRPDRPTSKKSDHLIPYKGEQITITEAARRSGIKRITLQARICRYGWPEDRWFEPITRSSS
jgi:hypothetical protein